MWFQVCPYLGSKYVRGGATTHFSTSVLLTHTVRHLKFWDFYNLPTSNGIEKYKSKIFVKVVSASMRVKSTYALWNRLQCCRRLTILNVWSRRYNFNGYNFVYLAFYTRFEVVDSNVPSPGCLKNWGSPCFSLYPIDGPLNKCFNGRFISGAFCGPEFTSWKCHLNICSTQPFI